MPDRVLIDISVPVTATIPLYPGDPDVRFESVYALERGDVANLTCLHVGAHSGTHFDTPHHILGNGVTLEHLPLDVCYGPAQVIHLSDKVQAITADILAPFQPFLAPRLLFRTRNSAFWTRYPNTFREDYAALDVTGAQLLADAGILLAGIDYLSIELFTAENLPAHRILLSRDIVILEGLDLSRAEAGVYQLMAFPVLYAGLDGGPTRAVLSPLPQPC